MSGAIDPIVLTGTSPTSAGNGVTVGRDGLSGYEAFSLIAELVGATGGVLDVLVQHSDDNVKFYDYCHFPQLAAAASAIVTQYTPALNDAMQTIGVDSHTLAAGLAAGAGVGGPMLRYVRLLMIAGTSTTVGAAVTVTIFGKRKTATT